MAAQAHAEIAKYELKFDQAMMMQVDTSVDGTLVQRMNIEVNTPITYAYDQVCAQSLSGEAKPCTDAPTHVGAGSEHGIPSSEGKVFYDLK
jgi:hypothetical protein